MHCPLFLHREAIRWTEEYKDHESDQKFRTEADLIIAMSNEHLGDHVRAVAAYEQASQAIESKLPKAGEGDLTGFQDWILCHVLRREAEGLINGNGPATRAVASTQAAEKGTFLIMDTFYKIGMSPFLRPMRITLVRETDDKVIGIPNQVRPTGQSRLNFLLEP